MCDLVEQLTNDNGVRVSGGNMNTLSEIMITAAINNRIAWQWVLDVRFINGLSLTTGIVVKMC